jgi:Gp157 protein
MQQQIIDAVRIKIERLLLDYPEMADDEVLRADMLSAETEIDDVMTSLIRAGEDARAFRDGGKEQISRLQERGKRFDRRIEYTRELLMTILAAANLRKKELPEATVYIRHNPPSIVGDLDPAKLPDDVVRIERKVNKTLLREAMEAGRSFDGLQFSNSPPSVVVSVR